LPVPCENCGFANEAAERYCGGCGHPIVGERIGAIEAERNVDPEGDRRPVTVLFCDLVGYTHLSSVLDAEDVHALLERFFALVDATVDRFGGTIDKHIGDAAMALFGAPLAEVMMPSGRARRFGDTDFRSKARIRPTVRFAVHIGIATGEAIASSEANTIGLYRHWRSRQHCRAATAESHQRRNAGFRRRLSGDKPVVSYEPLGPLALKGG
jgi:class 3 adenylate cyclase